MATARRLLLAAVPASLAALLPGGVSADPDKDESGKGRAGDKGAKKEEQKRQEQRPAPPPQPVSRSVPLAPTLSLPAPSGSEQLVSGRIRITGHDGSGAGPILLDVEGARAASAYQVLYVPQASPGGGVMLGTVHTDPSGAFKGFTPESLPAIAETSRVGVVVFRRLTS